MNVELNYSKSLGSEVSTVIDMKTFIFWDIMPCSTVKENGRFGGTYRLEFEVGAKKETSVKPVSSGFLVSLFFNREDLSYMFLRNVG
jgi:hypothetical protein